MKAGIFSTMFLIGDGHSDGPRLNLLSSVIHTFAVYEELCMCISLVHTPLTVSGFAQNLVLCLSVLQQLKFFKQFTS